MTELSIFFPCYNEEANIRALLNKTHQFCKRHINRFEILVVNDGSKDKTAQIVKEMCVLFPEIRLINHEKNLGYGAALISGFRQATLEYVFYTDGDGQFEIDELADLLPKLNPKTVFSGYRAHRKDPFFRKLNATIFNLAFNVFFMNLIRDIDCSFKIYPKWFLDQTDLWSQGALIDGEMLIKSKRKGLKIEQFPVKHYPRVHGAQTGAKLKVIFRAMLEFLKLWFRLYFLKK